MTFAEASSNSVYTDPSTGLITVLAHGRHGPILESRTPP